MTMRVLDKSFYAAQATDLAPCLLGKWLCRRMPDGTVLRRRILETECYFGEEDTACHAHKGRTKRTDTLYLAGGVAYVYLCYGVHWLLNIVTGEENHPEAVLIRACEGKMNGPGRLTKALQITGQLNRGSILGDELWVEDDGVSCAVATDTRVGIGYASEEDQSRLWRFKLK